MRPPAGSYRLTTTTPPTNVVYTIGPGGIPTTFGLLVWEEPPGWFRHLSIAIEFTGPSTFIAHVGAPGGVAVQGTYAPL